MIPAPIAMTSSAAVHGGAGGSSAAPQQDHAAAAAASSNAFARGESVDDAAPSLEAAKAYGRIARPLRIRDPHQPSGYRLARVGEAGPAVVAAAAASGKKAPQGSVARVADAAGGAALQDGGNGPPQVESYAFWSTHLQQLDEFGIGVALYFRQLAFLSLLFLGAGLLYTPTLWHNYRHVNGPDTPWLLKGSSLGAERGDLSFLYHGTVDLVVCAFLLVFAVGSKEVEDAAAAAIDTAQQTTQDYAVEVLNAPRQSKDPEAYAAYFRQFGDVVFVTIALDNGRLLRLLRRRRELRALLANNGTIEGLSLLEAERGGANLEALQPPRPSWPKRLLSALGLYSHVSLVAAEYLQVQRQVASEAAKGPGHLRVKRVYAVFNTEAAQRACLEAHRRGGLLPRLLRLVGLGGRGGDPVSFEGRALRVQEPVEPSEVRYEAFDVPAWERGLRYAVSTLLAASSLGLSYALLSLARGQALYTAAVTSGMNVALPLVLKTVVATVEVHIDQSDAQDSILQKLVVARVFAVVVLKYAVTDYAATMSAATLGGVASILIADSFTNPVLSVLNLPGRFRQWVLAPRAKSQREMNLYFAGSDWSLAERYTDLVKTAFLSLFWSSIFPGGCFLTALAFFIVSYTDKYCLLYQWKRPPLLDSTLARRARNFLVVGVAVHIIMARVFFANWPYSSTEERARCGLLFCTDRAWFTPPQARIVAIFTVLGMVSLALVVLIYGSFALGSCLRRCCPRRRKGRVAAHDAGASAAAAIPFRALVGAEPYLPLVHSSLFPEPFFAFNAAAVPLPPRFLPVCPHHHHHHHHLRQAAASGAGVDDDDGGGDGAATRRPHGRSERQGGLARLSLCSRKDLPTVADAAARAGLFSTVRYFPLHLPEGGESGGGGGGAATAAAGGAVVADAAGASASVTMVPNPSPVAPKNRMMQMLTPAQLQRPAVAVSLTAARPLPPGWVVMVDARDGHPYYFHEPTQTVHWEDPTGAVAAAAAAAAAAAEREEEAASMT